jgi:hypothetical protein
MRLSLLLACSTLPFALLGCTGKPDDSGTDSADADTDTDTDTDTDVDDSGPAPTAVLTGTVAAYDGVIAADVEVQACVTTCFSGHTDAAGTFTFSEMEAGEYKLDVVGEGVDGKDYGRMRVQAIVEDAGTWTAPGPLFMPQMYGPTAVSSSGTFSFGPVQWAIDPAILTIPFGYDEGMYSVGLVAGTDIAAFWPVTPAIAVAFGPLATEVDGSFDLSIQTGAPAGSYSVYSVDLHGALEGPVGTATADGTTLIAIGLSPSLLTWLLFVPQ